MSLSPFFSIAVDLLGRMLKSPLMNAEEFMPDLESAYEQRYSQGYATGTMERG
jgi:hypothetical protein